jgi:co-chaperonin GroES (HSP10)
MLILKKNNIAVVPVGTPDKTEGGLWIPEIAKKRANQGVVKYVGSAVRDIAVGDYVLFSGYTGTTVRLSGGEGVVIIMHEDFVNAKIGLAENIIVPGLYFYGGSKLDDDEKIYPGKIMQDFYFPATYESAVPLIAAALEDFGNRMKVTAPKPTKEEYNQHEND